MSKAVYSTAVHTTTPPELACLGSPDASKDPSCRIRTTCAALYPGATQVTLCPSDSMNATVALLYVYSNATLSGKSWSCRRGCARASPEDISRSMTLMMFWRVEVMIRLPPPAPATRYTLPSGRVTITGVMDDSGRFPGRM